MRDHVRGSAYFGAHGPRTEYVVGQGPVFANLFAAQQMWRICDRTGHRAHPYIADTVRCIDGVFLTTLH